MAKAYLKAHPRCVGYKCEEPAVHVDHINPHKGDMKKFWDRSNWQPLCWHCHNRKTQQERVGKSAFDERGRPTSADHPWNIK